MSCEFYKRKLVKARKQHKCDLCKDTIEVGQVYSYEFGKFDGDIFENHMCESCKEFQDAFVNINRNDLDQGYTIETIIDDINETVCYECRVLNGDDYCKCSYYQVMKCEHAKELYKKKWDESYIK